MEHVSFFRREDLLHPALRMVGYAHTAEAVPGRLVAHDHGPLHEICTIERGVAHWWVEDEVHELHADHVYLTRPGERHGAIDAVLGPCAIRWAIVDLAPRGTPAWDAAAGAVQASSARAFAAPAAVHRAMAALLDEHQHRRSGGPAMVEALVLQLLVELQRAADSSQGTPAPRRVSAPVRRAVDHLHRRLTMNDPVALLAAVAGLGTAAFHARFRAETGFTPVAYRNRLRVLRARALLRGDRRSITAIAYDLGFPSSQYFATVFRRYTGTTPSAWRSVGA